MEARWKIAVAASLTDRAEHRVAIADVAGDLLHPGVGRWALKKGVQQDELFDGFGAGRTGQLPAFEKLLAELGTEESAAAGDDDFHASSGMRRMNGEVVGAGTSMPVGTAWAMMKEQSPPGDKEDLCMPHRAPRTEW